MVAGQDKVSLCRPQVLACYTSQGALSILISLTYSSQSNLFPISQVDENGENRGLLFFLQSSSFIT